jgi:hypothetical protein
VQQSGCFTLVNRGRSMQSRAMERALADSGELQRGSNLGRGQVRAADYFLEPNIVSANRNSGGSNVGAALGSIGGGLFGRGFGAIAGGISVKKGEANVTLSIVNARTTEEEALTEGYARKSDVSFGGGAAAAASGAPSAGPAAAAIRTRRSARSSCSPISMPIPSWSRSSAACPTMRRRAAPRAN